MTTQLEKQVDVSAPPPGEFLDDGDNGTQQFVTFIAGDEVFAVDMAPVQEIIRLPSMVRVPLAPSTLEGLANLRGKVLPIISLRRIFGFDEREYDESTRAVVVDIGQPLGFVVDRVSSVVGVDTRKIEDVGSIRGTVNTELLSGVIKDVGGHAMIMVLDFARLIAREYASIEQLARTSGVIAGQSEAAEVEDEASSDELQLVSFSVAGQEYAMPINDVQEIVQMPERIVHVPHSESHVLGVMTLRNRLLPLVSLRRMFDLPRQDESENNRIVVVSVGGMAVGVVMDTVNEVLRVPRREVDPVPALLSRHDDLADVTEICRIDGGKRMVSIISAENLFRHSAVKEALTTVGTAADQELEANATDVRDEDGDDDEQVVVFRLDKEEFGVPIASVQEIVRVPDELTHVPKAPGFVEGVINLRGTVLPVVDLRRRLGLPAIERTDRQRIMVIMIEGTRTGFIVDVVTEVLKIARAAIEPAPRLSSEQGRLLARMANLEKQKRMVQLIEPGHLIDGGDLTALAGMAA